LPEAADVLLDRSGIPDQEAVLRTSLQVLKGARQQTTMAMRGAFAIAAHELLAKLYIEGEAPPLARPPYAQLGKLGASCEYDGHGDSWDCAAPALVAAFMRQYPHARWSHLFYLEALGAECEGAGYAEVIKEGIPWLRRHPNSEFAPFLTAAIAAAYETRWSLSLASEDEEFVRASDYADGAAAAREQAIRWYDRLQQKYPESAEAKAAVLNSNQVKIGVDTGQRRFYCVIP
jgi:hypothetical protein